MKRTIVVAALALAGCEGHGSTDSAQAEATEQMVSEANRQVGMPRILNFTQRKLAREIMELCDTEGLSTYTYVMNMHGEARFLCESIGYGLPFSTQFTNPERRIYGANGGTISLPQPDPNGLFMPTASSATWVIAVTPDGPKPLYVESEILVLPYRLEGVQSVTEPR